MPLPGIFASISTDIFVREKEQKATHPIAATSVETRTDKIVDRAASNLWNWAMIESIISSDMLLSRLFSGARSNDPIRFALACSRRCLSSSSPATSSANESKDDSNEWLWSYLRDRKTFAELNDQQKRRVIEIGANNRHFDRSLLLFCRDSNLERRWRTCAGDHTRGSLQWTDELTVPWIPESSLRVRSPIDSDPVNALFVQISLSSWTVPEASCSYGCSERSSSCWISETSCYSSCSRQTTDELSWLHFDLSSSRSTAWEALSWSGARCSRSAGRRDCHRLCLRTRPCPWTLSVEFSRSSPTSLCRRHSISFAFVCLSVQSRSSRPSGNGISSSCTVG